MIHINATEPIAHGKTDKEDFARIPMAGDRVCRFSANGLIGFANCRRCSPGCEGCTDNCSRVPRKRLSCDDREETRRRVANLLPESTLGSRFNSLPRVGVWEMLIKKRLLQYCVPRFQFLNWHLHQIGWLCS